MTAYVVIRHDNTNPGGTIEAVFTFEDDADRYAEAAVADDSMEVRPVPLDDEAWV